MGDLYRAHDPPYDFCRENRETPRPLKRLYDALRGGKDTSMIYVVKTLGLSTLLSYFSISWGNRPIDEGCTPSLFSPQDIPTAYASIEDSWEALRKELEALNLQ